MTEVVVVLDGVRISMDWEPRFLAEFDAWRADRQLFNRSDAIRRAIRWAAAHDTTGRQKPVQPDTPVLAQLDAFMHARTLIARTEGAKLAILTVLRQPWPDGNAAPVEKVRRNAGPELPRAPRLVVDNEGTPEQGECA